MFSSWTRRSCATACLICLGFATAGAHAQLSWTLQPTTFGDTLNAVAFGIDDATGDRQFVAVGTNTVNATVATSPDGLNWTRQNSGIGGAFSGVAHNGAVWVAVGTNSAAAIAATSPDGMTWTMRSTGLGGTLNDIIWWGTEFVAVGGNSGQGIVARSPDGVAWTSEFTGVATTLNAIDTSGFKALAVGSQGQMLESIQHGPFQLRTAVTGNELLGVTFKRATPTEGLFFAVGTNGALVRSDDFGGTFGVVPPVTADHLHDLAWSGATTVAVGTDGRVLCSTDNGLMWNDQISITGNHLYGVTFGVLPDGTGRFVAVGTTGAVHTTDFGISSGGGGTLNITVDGPTSFTHLDGSGEITLAASGGDVDVAVVSPANWITNDWGGGSQTIPEDTQRTLTFGVTQNFEHTPRSGTIFIHHNGVTEVGISQSGGVPATPSTIPAKSTTGESIGLTLNEPVRPVSGHRVERFLGLDGGGGEIWQLETTLGPAARDYQITGLDPWTQYRIRITAFNPNGASLPHEFTERTDPTYPQNLTVTPENWSQATVTWNDVPGAFLYALERRIGAGGTWVFLGDVPIGTQIFRDGGLPADTEIAYRMTTKPNLAGPERWSETSPEAVARTGVYAGVIYWGDAEAVPIGGAPQADLMAVAAGGGRYTAVGDSGEIVGSSDGTTWTVENSGTSELLFDVAHGNGVFVAVGGGGTILTSSGNGTWTPAVSGTTNIITRVAFGAGTFVATQIGGPVLKSADGVTWTPQADSFQAFSLTFDNGQFLVLHGFGGAIDSSTNGSMWTEVRSGGALRLSFAWGGGLWLGVGIAGGITTSPDGLTWTDSSRTSTESLNSVTYANGRFISVGMKGTGGTILRTTDAVTWSEVAVSGSGGVLNDVAWGANGFVAVGDGGVVLLSADGETWGETRPSIPAGGAGGGLTAVRYGAGAVVAAGDGIVWRRDPATRTWSEVGTFPAPGIAWWGVSFANGAFYISGATDSVFSSSDGISWTTIPLPAEADGYQAVEYGLGRLVAVGTQSIVYSDDGGANWDQSMGSFIGLNLRDVIFRDGLWVASGQDRAPLRISTDGIKWDPPRFVSTIAAVSGGAETAHGLVFGAKTFVTLAHSETHVSRDGQFWVPNAHTAQDVAYGDGVFVSVDQQDVVRASLDGVNWETAPAPFLPPMNGYLGIAYGGNAEFTTVGHDREVHTFRVSSTPIMRADDDGVPDATEAAAPNGGDGNNDGTADAQQSNVASVPALGGNYVTIAAPAGQQLTGVAAVVNPSPVNLPFGAQFPLGFITFTVTGVLVGGATVVEIHVPPGVQINAYYKYGPTPGNPTPHWYRFDFDPTSNTGAVITPGLVTLQFVDGARGDDDLTANGTITDDGGAALVMVPPGAGQIRVIELAQPPEGHFRIVVETEIGEIYRLQSTENLLGFQTREIIQANATETEFVDADAPSQPKRLYRVLKD